MEDLLQEGSCHHRALQDQLGVQTGMDQAKSVCQNSSLGPSVSTDSSKYWLKNICFSNSMSVAFLSSEVPTHDPHILSGL